MPDGRHEPLFERGHEDAISDPIGSIGGRFAIRDNLKLLHDRPGFEEEFAHALEEEDGAVCKGTHDRPTSGGRDSLSPGVAPMTVFLTTRVPGG